MSLYIHQENQKLIWESICKLPMFQEFEKHEQGKRETWFRTIIQQFYESNKFKMLSMEELQQLNRETVSYMLNELKTINRKEEPVYYNGFSSSSPFGDMSPVNSERSISSFSSMPPENKHVTRDAILEKKQEQLNVQFSARQQEYGSMLNAAPTQEIDFRLDTQGDIPMENIDALMEDKMKQRKYDLVNTGFQPPTSDSSDSMSSPPFSSPRTDFQLDVIDLGKTNSPIESSIQQNNLISHDEPTQIVRSQRFPYKDITDTPQKNVRWNETVPSEPIKHRPPQYSRSVDTTSVFKDFMEDIRDTMNDMKREILSLKQNRGHPSSQNTQVSNQNPLVNNIVSRMKRKTQPATQNASQLQDVTNDFI